MRLPNSIRSLLLTAIFLCASIAATPAENGSGGDAQQEVRQRYDSISFAGGDFQISEPALVPRQLALAAEQSHCHYKGDIKELPIHFIRTENFRIALVFCRTGVTGSHRAFDLRDSRKPTQMEFPVPSHEGGFGTTSGPGMITWKKEAGVFEAEKGSDMICTGRGRYTYRLGRTDPSFAIIRVEIKKNECIQNEWTTIWDAPTWSELIR